MVAHFISMTALQGRYYCAHFIDEENWSGYINVAEPGPQSRQSGSN